MRCTTVVTISLATVLSMLITVRYIYMRTLGPSLKPVQGNMHAKGSFQSNDQRLNKDYVSRVSSRYVTVCILYIKYSTYLLYL